MQQLDSYVNEIKRTLEAKANFDISIQQKRYMRNKFEFFGIKANSRRKATGKFMKKAERPEYYNLSYVVKKLWVLPEREFQYFGLDLVERYIDDFDRGIMELLEYMIINKSWWDTVDMVAKKFVGQYFIKFPNKKKYYLSKWIDSDNIWLQRTAILFQLGYKEDTDIELLFKIIHQLKDIDEFFIQKAIGWSLRQYSRVDGSVIVKFVENNELSSLAEREALKTVNS